MCCIRFWIFWRLWRPSWMRCMIRCRILSHWQFQKSSSLSIPRLLWSTRSSKTYHNCFQKCLSKQFYLQKNNFIKFFRCINQISKEQLKTTNRTTAVSLASISSTSCAAKLTSNNSCRSKTLCSKTFSSLDFSQSVILPSLAKWSINSCLKPSSKPMSLASSKCSTKMEWMN